ncbi:MAG: hypothetical protein AAF266_03835 [Planctomycetota bacterium]
MPARGPVKEIEPCDLAVWDTHGDLTPRVREELRAVVKHQAARLTTAAGVWQGGRIVVGWPRRVTASRLPPVREAVSGLVKVHRPRALVIVGPAAVGSSNQRPGQAIWLEETPDVATRWATEAKSVCDELEIAIRLLAAITHLGLAAPSACRPTAARVAGRWLGRALGGSGSSEPHDASLAVAERLSELLRGDASDA